MKKFVLCVMAIACALIATSCNNFMNAKNVKEEIQDFIEYNNAKTINVSISCKEEMGSVLPSQNIQVKLGYNFDIQFIPNTQNYTLKNPQKLFEAVSWKDNSVSRNDCVEFRVLEQTLEDKKSGLYRIKAKVTKDVDDIQIRPECILRPAVTSVTPEINSSKSYDANTTIIVTFNTSLANDNGEALSIPYGEDGIEIKYGSIDMSSYFELPVVADNKVIIQPKGGNLAAFMQELPFVDISVSFSEKFKIVQNDTDVFLAPNDKSSFVIKFNNNIEETAPSFYKLFASRSTIRASEVVTFPPANSFLIQDLDKFDTAEEVIKNSNNGTFYISGHAFDEDSGVKRIEIIEQYLRDNEGETTGARPEDPQIFTKENSEFIADENGNTYFSIPYVAKSENGAIQLTVTIYDACNNSVTKSFVVFKKFYDDSVFNAEVNIKNGFMFRNAYYTDYDSINNWLKRIHYNPYTGLYNLYTFRGENPDQDVKIQIPASDFTVSCTYNSQALQFNSYNEQSEEWYHLRDNENLAYLGYFDLPVEKVSGASFTISIADTLGNKAQKTFTIVNSSDLGYIATQAFTEDYNWDTHEYYDVEVYMIKFYYKPDPSITNYLTCSIYDQTEYPDEPPKAIRNNSDIYPNIDYDLVPYFSGFYTDYADFNVNISPFEKADLIESATAQIAPELNEDGLAQITLNVSMKQGAEYDFLYASYYVPVGSYTVYEYFSGKSLTKTFALNPDLINKHSLGINIFAIKNGQESKSKRVTVNEGYVFYSYLDNEPPEYRIYRSDYYNVTVSVTDNSETSCKGSIQFHNTNQKIPLTDGNNLIPIRQFDMGDNYFTISITDNITEDNPDGKNSFSETENFYMSSDEVSTISNIKWHETAAGTGLRGWVMDSLDGDSFSKNRMHGNFYEFDPSDNSWSEISPDSNETTFDSRDVRVDGIIHTYIKIQNPSISESCGSFIKVLSYYQMYDYAKIEFWPVPFYFYADSSIRNSGNYDYIQTHSKTVFFVVSDAPTLVQTIVANASDSYEDCKNWTAYEWLSHNEVVDEKQYDFAHVENPTAQKYVISPSVLNKIKQGECYCVIAHFADGTTYVSDVFKK